MKLLSPILRFSMILTMLFVLPSSALAATLSLSPSTATFNKGCQFTLDINLDTTGADTDGTDAILIYDSTRVTATSIDTDLATKIYSDFPGSNIDDATGKVTVSGLASVSSAFNGKGTLAKVNFVVKDAAATGATQIKFDFNSSDKAKTTDSNVVQRGTVADILSSVTNGNYTIGTGACAGATASPGPGVTVLPKTGGQGATFISTPSGQITTTQIPTKSLDNLVGGSTGTAELTFTLAIIGSVLTILGVLGLALL